MKVLVDTCIWSVALRRQKTRDNALTSEIESLIRDFRVQLIGPVRQELLSDIKVKSQFEKLKKYLRAFPDYIIQTEDYEIAAHMFNQCLSKGIQGSNTDFLLCAVSINKNWPIFTTDNDFYQFQKVIPIELYARAR